MSRCDNCGAELPSWGGISSNNLAYCNHLCRSRLERRLGLEEELKPLRKPPRAGDTPGDNPFAVGGNSLADAATSPRSRARTWTTTAIALGIILFSYTLAAQLVHRGIAPPGWGLLLLLVPVATIGWIAIERRRSMLLWTGLAIAALVFFKAGLLLMPFLRDRHQGNIRP